MGLGKFQKKHHFYYSKKVHKKTMAIILNYKKIMYEM